MMGGAKAHYDGIVAFSQTDFTEDLKKITVPVLVMHSEDDQIVPYVAAGPLSAKLLKKRNPDNLQGLSARHAHDARGEDQCRPVGVPQGLRISASPGTLLRRSDACRRGTEAVTWLRW
jgi:dienelactone hydrolase